MKLRVHDNYDRLVHLARDSHAHGRSIAAITPRDVDLARLYCHAFRAHVIGAFHATREALQAHTSPTREREAGAESPRSRFGLVWAIDGLASLANQSLDPVFADFRAVISNFHRYDSTIRQVQFAMEAALNVSLDPRLELVRDRFQQAMERITMSNGIIPARDDQVPEQANFVVPSLGITIVPLVYGDWHCWNIAYLAGQARDVPRHFHREGVEIHLGFGKLRGFTVLGDCRAELTEGYAMAIPPETPHGFINTSGHDHVLPFIFGSLRLGGWGIVLDVEPQPVGEAELKLVRPDAPEMNELVWLDREINRAAVAADTTRRTLMKPRATYRPGCGGLCLSVARVSEGGLTFEPGPFRIVAVVRGRGRVQIGPVARAVEEHDHFGIPTGMPAAIYQLPGSPLVVLEAMLVEHP